METTYRLILILKEWLILRFGKLFCLVTIILIQEVTHVIAQSFPFHVYTTVDGLPENQAYLIMQDRRGFLWIFTTNMVTRFDGIEFVNYAKNDSVFNNPISHVFEDNKGYIWFFNSSGISKYNGDGFDHFFPGKELNVVKFLGHHVSPEKNNTMYLACVKRGGTKGSIITFNDSIYSDYSINYRALDTINVVGTNFDNSTNALLIFSADSRLWSWKNENLTFLHDSVLAVSAVSEGIEVLIEDSGYFIYKDGKFKYEDPFNEKSKPAVLINSHGNHGDLRYFDGDSIFSLNTSFTAYNCKFDEEGCLWLGSDNSLRKLVSTAFSSITELETGLETIWAMVADKKGHLWLGSLRGSGLVEYDGKTFKLRNEFKKYMPEGSLFFKGSRLMKNGDIWFSMNQGVLIWDGKSFSKFKGIPDDAQVCYIYEDPDDKTVMIGTTLGLYIINHGVINLDTRFTSAMLGITEGIVKDDRGIYWISGQKGIIRFDGWNAIPVRQKILPSISTFTSVKDSFGGIWITSNSGLLFKEKDSDNFAYGIPEPLNTPAKSIAVLDKNHILVGRVADICIIDLEKFYRKENEYFRIYDMSDGFEGGDCLDNGIVMDNSGKFWILTSNRIVRFDPSKLIRNLRPPKLNITGLYFRNDSLDWITAEKGGFFYRIPENLELKNYQNTIKITYTGISTRNPARVTYRYKLEGYDKKWSRPAMERSQIFEKLPPGTYTFLLKASNGDGVETIEPLSLRFTILPAFWQTKLFFFMIIIISVAAIVSITWFILKRKQQRKEQKEQLIQELSQLQMKLVIRQFDPHFTFNVISSVGTLILREQREIAYDYIIKLAGLLRTVLSDGSPMIKPLSDELDFVQRYCELTKLRFKERFCFTINVDSDVNTGMLIPKMLIQTFVENSIKHGFENLENGGQVDISLCRKNNCLQILIRDNGIGRLVAATQKSFGTGHGLKIISAIFEEMNIGNDSPAGYEIIDLTDEGQSAGTEIRILIPDDYRFVIHKKRYEKKYTLV